MVDHTSEELIYNIQADHEKLQFMHETYAEILGGTIEQAREVHARAEIAKLTYKDRKLAEIRLLQAQIDLVKSRLVEVA